MSPDSRAHYLSISRLDSAAFVRKWRRESFIVNHVVRDGLKPFFSVLDGNADADADLLSSGVRFASLFHVKCLTCLEGRSARQAIGTAAPSASTMSGRLGWFAPIPGA